jgi:GTP cyclohydrolase I
MTTRGVHKINTSTITKTMLGEFEQYPELEKKFLTMINFPSPC